MRVRATIAMLLGAAAVYVACSADSILSRRTSGTGGDASGSPVPTADAQPATSGTRLKARYYVADDGSRQFVGFYDSQKASNCVFRPAPDRVIRCLPENMFSATVPDFGNLNGFGAPQAYFFSDPSCTQKLAWAQARICASTPTPDLVLDAVTDGCTVSQTRYFSVGPPYTGTVHFMLFGSSQCGSLGPQPGALLYTVGAELPASLWAEFVTATEQRD